MGIVWDARVRWRLASRRHPVRRWHLAAVAVLMVSLWVGVSLLGGWRADRGLERQAAQLAGQDQALSALLARETVQLEAAGSPGWAAEQARAEGLVAPGQAVYVISPPPAVPGG